MDTAHEYEGVLIDNDESVRRFGVMKGNLNLNHGFSTGNKGS